LVPASLFAFDTKPHHSAANNRLPKPNPYEKYTINIPSQSFSFENFPTASLELNAEVKLGVSHPAIRWLRGAFMRPAPLVLVRSSQG